MGLSGKRGQRGITLIELMVALAIVSVLVAVAMPSYRAYVVRSRLPVALDALTSYATRLEQAYQDVGNYGVANCMPAAVPTPDNFTVACALGNNGQGFTVTATGSGIVSGYTFSIDNLGIRRTVSHPRGVPAANCWSLKGGSCDT